MGSHRGEGMAKLQWMVSSCKMAGIHSRRNKQKYLISFNNDVFFTKSGSCFSLNHDCRRKRKTDKLIKQH